MSAALRFGRSDLADEYERRLPFRARVVAFLDRISSVPGGYAVSQEQGLYVDCPGGDTVDGPSPGWDGIDNVDDVVEAFFA
jgi:hypothetical protein